MIRGLSRFYNSCLQKSYIGYYSTTNEKDNLVPSVVDHSEKFYGNLYGIELEKHILPYCSARFSWKA